ncbi:MAG: hemerythrin domain-containing protein [Bryobacteraceae bacterium]
MISIRTAPAVATLDSPVDHLAACHRRIEERLDTLERVAPHLQARPEEALAAIQTAFRFFDSSGVNHTADEEQSFFPRLAAHITAEERRFLSDLQIEHTRAEGLYDELKAHVASMASPPTAACQIRYTELAAALCALYRQHIRNEDARFPAIVARTLPPAGLEAISVEMKRRRGL